MNYRDLCRILIDEESCILFLQQYKILPTQVTCDNGHQMAMNISKLIRWRCRKATCRIEKSIRQNTWLEGSKLSLEVICHFIYGWAFELTSIKFSQREFHMANKTVIDWNNYLREVCNWRVQQNKILIGGVGLTVEIDESLFTRRKNNAGRILPQQWMFGGICRETKECFIVNVENRKAETLMPIIQRFILPGTIIISDCWRAYKGIQSSGDHMHQTVNHQHNFVDPDTGAHTQGIERMWRSVKFRNKKHSGTARDFMDSYLAEYMWRSRLKDRNPFTTILEDIAAFWQSLKK